MFLTNDNGETYYFEFLKNIFPISDGKILEAANNDTIFKILVYVIKKDNQIIIEKYNYEKLNTSFSVYSLKEEINNNGLFLYKLSNNDAKCYELLNKEHEIIFNKHNDEITITINDKNQKILKNNNTIFHCMKSYEKDYIEKQDQQKLDIPKIKIK